MTKKTLVEREIDFFSNVNSSNSFLTIPSSTVPVRNASTSSPAVSNFVENEVLVKLSPPPLAASDRSQGLLTAAQAVGGEIAEVIRMGDSAEASNAMVARITLGKGVGVDQAIQILSKLPLVQVAEPNWTYTTQAISNDASYTGGVLWGMYGDSSSLGGGVNAFGSQANEAWNVDKLGSTKTVVGVIDSGIDYTHPDLYLNVWLNQGEIRSLSFFTSLKDVDSDGLITLRDLNNSQNASLVSDKNSNGRIDAGDLLQDSRWEDGLDNDANGYRDDLIGWDFVNNDNDPMDDNNHGTHVSGTIGAMGGNGSGVVGVNWDVQLVGLKFLSGSGSGSTAGAISAINYYTSAAQAAQKALSSEHFVATNNSWGGGGFSQTLLDAISASAKQDLLFVAAAGNSSSNNDSTASYPSNYSTASAAGYDAVVAVAALDSLGALASFSSFGANTVDIAAPGVGIVSTTPDNSYASFNGTSMATPHVTGALALLSSINSALTAAELKNLLLSTAAPTSSILGKALTGGRLDIGGMLNPVTPEAGKVIWGNNISETITGGSGADRLAGVPSSGASPGRGTIDQFFGNGGADVFLLGDARGRFYDDGSSKSRGTGDYGFIRDFNKFQGDKIQLKGVASEYFFANVSLSSGVSGVGIFHDSNVNRIYNSNSDELIGIVGGYSSGSLSATDLVFV